MLGTTYYHGTVTRITYGFGTLFNNIFIERKDSNKNTVQKIRVPFSFEPKEKFMVRINEDASIDDVTKVKMQLPRMGFEILGISYDSTRKRNTVNRYKVVSPGNDRLTWQYEGVPYNIEYTVNIMTKNIDDGLQIVEQILPYFSPEFNITIKSDSDLNRSIDVPIFLNTVTNETEYEGDFETTRLITWALSFTAKAWLYPPTSTTGIIRKVIVQTYPQTTDISLEDRETTKPGKELVRIVVLPDPITANAGDDFDFNVQYQDLYV